MKKTLHFKVLAGVVAMLLALPTVGLSATIDWGLGDTNGSIIDPITGVWVVGTDLAVVANDATSGAGDGTVTVNSALLQTDGTFKVAAFPSTTIEIVDGAPGQPGDQIVTQVLYNGITYDKYETLLINDATETATTTSDGGVTLQPNGDATLEAGGTTVDTTWIDTVRVTFVSTDPNDPEYGNAVPLSPSGDYTGTFTPGEGFEEGFFVTESVTIADPTGGDLIVGGDSLLHGDLTVEGATVTNGISNSDERITDVADAVDPTDAVNLGQMEAADGVLQDNIDAEEEARIAADNTLQLNIDAEEDARILADGVLQDNIDAEEEARIAADNTLQLNIDAEEDARILADGVLQDNIDAEEEARIAADNSLQADIDQEIADREDLIYRDEDGVVHVGTESLLIDETDPGYLQLSASDGDDIVILDEESDAVLIVEGESYFEGTLHVGIDAVSVDIEDGAGEIGDQVFDTTPPAPGAVSYVYTMTEVGETETTTTTSDGGATIDTNGNTVLTTGGILTEVTIRDYAIKLTIDSDPASPTYGETIATDNVVGIYTPGEGGQGTGTFVEGEVEVLPPVFDQTGVGANLTMDGDLTVGGDARVYKGDDPNFLTEEERAGYDVVIAKELDAETASREAADEYLGARIDNETYERMEADLYLDDRIDRVKNKVDDLEDRVDAVGAFSAAFSALVPNDRVAGNTQVSLGLGTYSGETALAAGLFHYFGDNILVNAGISHSMDESETAGRAGITYGF